MPPSTESADCILDIPTQRELTPSQLYFSLPLWAECRSIRVLDLDPISPAEQVSKEKESHTDDRTEHPLSGTLRVVSLSKSPKFTALSYVWGAGPSAGGGAIALRNATGGGGGDFCSLGLTENCHSALTQLRRRYGSITVWVDSICINQEDQQEKSSQIPLMKEIYTWASPVYVWLGEGNARSDKAVDYLSSVSTYEVSLDAMDYLLYPVDGLYGNAIPKPSTAFLTFFLRIRRGRALDAKLSGLFDMTCLEDLLDSRGRPWSQRVWTLQEFLLAWDVILLCGDRALHRNDFLRGLKYTKRLEMDESFTMIQSLPGCFHDWCSLLDLWIGCERPHIWNGQRMRYSPRYIHRALLPPGGSMFPVSAPGPDEADDLSMWYTGHLCCSIILLGLLPSFFRIFYARWYTLLIYLLAVYNALHSFAHIVDGGSYSTWPRPSAFLFFRWIKSASRWVAMLRGKDRSAEPVSALNGIMQAVRDRTASDPKDKSYAMYGVLESFGVSLSTPDYRKARGRVHQEFFSDLLAWHSVFLHLLMDVRAENGRPQPQETTPTWVPALQALPPRWLDRAYYVGENPHSATPATSRVRALAEGPYLRVSVQWHGNVTFSSGPLDPDDAADDTAAQAGLQHALAKCLHWFSWLRVLTPSTPVYESVSNAVFPVVEGGVREESAGGGFNEWYRVIMELIRAYGPAQFDDPDVLGEALGLIGANEMARGYFERCRGRLVAARRNLFITSYGYLGSGPHTMVEGDQVALVSGLPVPMILRRAGDGSSGFTVVGPAFVHGLMKGEEWDEDKLQEVVLV
ncbi:hypothetical protein SLS58_010932 [Diplodia intermedia]|uniref:Heterokaryon incompatibility domain-containing protein n=1 Tax=Diplodia intermedia TaxID=856260 RepID=A0ABR3T2S0_9PEZI